MIRVCFLLIALVASFGLQAADEPQPGFTLLELDKQPAEVLPFFVRRAPVEAVASPTQRTKFGPLPEGITAHLTEIGHLPGRRLIAIRYLSDARLKHGNNLAVGLVLLCSLESDQTRFAPLIVAWGEDQGIVDDYSVSAVRQFDNFFFIWVRRNYSGTSNYTERVAIAAPDAHTPLREYALFAETDPLAEFVKAGWEPWHRGNFFDEETLTDHFHLYRDPAKATEKGEYPHRYIRVRYKFRDGKLQPEKPEDEERDG